MVVRGNGFLHARNTDQVLCSFKLNDTLSVGRYTHQVHAVKMHFAEAVRVITKARIFKEVVDIGSMLD